AGRGRLQRPKPLVGLLHMILRDLGHEGPSPPNRHLSSLVAGFERGRSVGDRGFVRRQGRRAEMLPIWGERQGVEGIAVHWSVAFLKARAVRRRRSKAAIRTASIGREGSHAPQ